MSTINFSGCEHQIEASAAEFGGSSFVEVSFAESAFSIVTFAGASFDTANFEGCSFDSVRFDGARFAEVSFKNIALREGHLEGLTIEGIPAAELLAAWRKTRTES
ncbi:pentapeptide repeat-containing protein [Nguyenibacter vanlangensis]|uniref:Pentapeptide repeat-containing protein n=1 Tax=Nguyenibacter vanlangensis TaxID=1216886 RepID=A0ABZ3D2I2_9PROT